MNPSSSSSAERDTSVTKTSSGKFESKIRWGGKKRHIGTFDTPEQETSSGKFVSQIRWGGKMRHIGTFDTREQASAAYSYVREGGS